MGGEKLAYGVFAHRADGVTVFFIDRPEYFDRDCLYGTSAGDYPDNGERFAFFCRAALETMRAIGFSPDILHGHDWQSALVFAYLRHVYAGDPFFARTRTLFTIHNLAYQGLFEEDVLGRIGLPASLFNMNDLEFYGKVNALKAGILYATAVTHRQPPLQPRDPDARRSAAASTASFAPGPASSTASSTASITAIGIRRPTGSFPAITGPADLSGKKICRNGARRAVRPDGAGGPPRRGHGHPPGRAERASTSSVRPSTTSSASG